MGQRSFDPGDLLMRALRIHEDERGASAVFIAATMVLLLGFTAIAIDVGAGFNERRQDQTAADTSVMAGAISFVDPADTDEDVSIALLDVARSNLDTVYTDAEWIQLWRDCQDPDRLSWDPGTGTPITFAPMPEPSSWLGGAGATIDCISKSSSFLRVRIPDQNVPTSFGRILGTANLTTHAVAIAQIAPFGGLSGLLPFGISGSAAAGELCLTTSGSGIAYPPCQGPDAGSFGPINSELFGDFFGTPDCGNPGAPELSQNIALGIDHYLDTWGDGNTNPEGVGLGSSHPGDVVTEGYSGVVHDQCRIQGGVRVPQVAGEEFPPNLLRVDTGFPAGPVEDGLISNTTFNAVSPPEASRLQQDCDDTLSPTVCASAANETRTIVKRRQGSNETLYELNNIGPWEFLTGSGICARGSYSTLPTTDAKVTQFHDCLRTYNPSDGVIFSEEILQSPRFAWAPQYWHQPSMTGTSWQPVYRYRMTYIGGIWFNCNASTNTCGAIFYPDSQVGGPGNEVCDVQASNCQMLDISQLSGWMFPDEAMPEAVRNSFPGGDTAFEPFLYR